MTEAINPQYLLLGEVLRPHGVRGELRMRVLTGYPERLNKLKVVYVAATPEAKTVTPHQVVHVRMHQDYALMTLADVSDRTQADAFRGCFILVSLEDAVPLEDDEVYLFQLIGMRVELESGDELGTLVDVLETGANDVYIVESPQYGEVLIPVTDETIIDTDTDHQRIVVRLPEGLLPT